jgi:glycerate-2-kinase
VTPDKRQAMAPENKEILLMQLTSTGKIEGVINLHGRTRGITDAAGAMVSGNAQIQETGLRFTCDPSQR